MSAGLWFYFWEASAWASAVNGDASGDTLLANASPIGGTFTGGAEVSGMVLAPAASLVSGSAAGAATADGVTLAVSASIVNGIATGTATATGATLSDTASVVSGEAAGAGQAEGQILSVTSSLLEGTEAGEGQAIGATLSATTQPVAGDVSGDGNVAGDLIAVAASTIPGEAAGGAATDAITTNTNASLIAGVTAADAQADGVLLALEAVHVYQGGGSGDAVATGDIASTALSLIDGQASGNESVNGTAQGATVEVVAALIDGVAVGMQQQQQQSSVGGGKRRRRRATPPVWESPFVQDAIAKGGVLSCQVGLIAGRAHGDAHARTALVVTATKLRRGRVNAGANTPATFISIRPRLIVGKASVDVQTRVVTMRRGVTLNAGKAEGFDAITYDNELITLIAA